LQLLCELITENEDLLAKVLAFEDKHLTLVASAVQYRHEECIKVLLELKRNNNWKNSHTGENILHIAVKTEQLHIVQLVNEKTKGTC
jgi:ankyrin repeat protein